MEATTEKPQRVPPRDGMVISAPGVLERAADRLSRTRDMNHLSFELRLLLKHIEQLHVEPTEANLREFLSLWRVD